ncbi:MAG: MmgE/PrpD family protein [Peptococcaceae bacterium]|jgi:2-methylcitrate dehydratase PrpD|nr:MmgE/PrpD family protein [Peptococcaceae bacterium]MDH7524868.1 MmgE/PrpD family protein [Peptococcaceae bacterium]
MDMTGDLSRHLEAVSYEKLPGELVETTKKFIMDTIGVGLAGINAPGCEEMTAILAGHGGRQEAAVIGKGIKLPSPAAAFLNSLYCHALDFDDTFDDSAMHCYVNVLPPAMALAEAERGVHGREFIAAIAAGVDLCARLGAAITTPLSWIRTATCGSFAAAASAAKVLKLDDEGIQNALGIVYSQTAGNAQALIDGGLTKRMQPAFSTRAGVLSALMARKGITGAQEVFEGRYGFYNLYERGEYVRENVYKGLGKDFYGMRLSIKPYPSCRMTHSSIDAALKAKEKHGFSFEEIEKVEVRVSKMCREMVGEPFKVRENPQVDAQFSIPYTVGVALKYGEPFIHDFDEQAVRERERIDAAGKVDVFADEKIEVRDLKPAAIKVVLKNGKILQERAEYPKGHPQNPMSWDDCITKFKKCVSRCEKEYRPEKINEMIEFIMNIEKFEDVGACIGVLF